MKQAFKFKDEVRKICPTAVCVRQFGFIPNYRIYEAIYVVPMSLPHYRAHNAWRDAYERSTGHPTWIDAHGYQGMGIGLGP